MRIYDGKSIESQLIRFPHGHAQKRTDFHFICQLIVNGHAVAASVRYGGAAGVPVKWIAGVRRVPASLMELRLLELEVSNDHLHLFSVGRPSMGSKVRQMDPIRVVEIAQPEVDVEPRATRCRDEGP